MDNEMWIKGIKKRSELGVTLPVSAFLFLLFTILNVWITVHIDTRWATQLTKFVQNGTCKDKR